MIGDTLFVGLYLPVAMILAVVGMVGRALHRVFGGER